jgi:hypothetical protein
VRHIITFKNLHQVLKAERLLKNSDGNSFEVRPTPTPQGLSSAVCGMSIEVLRSDQTDSIITFLRQSDLEPAGLHDVDS